LAELIGCIVEIAQVTTVARAYADESRGGDILGGRARERTKAQRAGNAPRPSQVWIAPEDPTILRLRLDNSSATCPNPAFNSSAASESGVMLVYTGQASADGPELLDEDGVAVPAFGSDWLLDRLAACVDGSYGYFCPLGDPGGHLPGLSSLVPIPCP
jgi:hypothetical protein